MKITSLLILMLLVPTVEADELSTIVNSTGYATIGSVFAKSNEDLYDKWAARDDDSKLKGSVIEFLDWSKVSRIVVIYNSWSLPTFGNEDIRIKHIQNNLKTASFGDRFKGKNPGGTYVFLLQYKDSHRDVSLSFDNGVFLIEDGGRIGVVDIREAR